LRPEETVILCALRGSERISALSVYSSDKAEQARDRRFSSLTPVQSFLFTGQAEARLREFQPVFWGGNLLKLPLGLLTKRNEPFFKEAIAGRVSILRPRRTEGFV